MSRNRPKRYPYTKSQYEYSCNKVYAGSDLIYEVWNKKNTITGKVAHI